VTDEPVKKYHRSVSTDKELSDAYDIARSILDRTTIHERAEDLYSVCLHMSVGQLAYALLNLKEGYPERDRAIADAFLELFRPRYVH
jgi:hypothetical protein